GGCCSHPACFASNPDYC
uniref:Alpha-conotoxin-like AnIC n=1 Tax=Conus anemone TaxID=101285 RepID=CA1C_CONAN|nr:RecName: Full=Alpha-conotoxin-like AnIC [Conus anemone]